MAGPGDKVSKQTLTDLVTGHDPVQDEIDKQIDDEIAAQLEKKRRAAASMGSKILDVGKQALGGMAEGALSTRIGWNELTGDELEANRLRSEDRREIEEWRGDPLSAVGTGAHVAGRVGYEVGEFVAPGAILGKAAGIAKATKAVQAAEAGSKLAKVGKVADVVGKLVSPGKEASAARKIATNVALAAPLNVAKASARENSTVGALADATGSETLKDVADSKLGRQVAEVATDVAGNAIAEGVVAGAKGIRGAYRGRKLANIRAARAAAAEARTGSKLLDTAGDVTARIRAGEEVPDAEIQAAAEQLTGGRSSTAAINVDPDDVMRRLRAGEDVPAHEQQAAVAQLLEQRKAARESGILGTAAGVVDNSKQAPIRTRGGRLQASSVARNQRELRLARERQAGNVASSSADAGGALSTSPTLSSEGTQAPALSSSVESVVPSETSRTARPSSVATRSTVLDPSTGSPLELGAVDPASGLKIAQPSSDLNGILEAAGKVEPQFKKDLEEAAAGIKGVHLVGTRAKHLDAAGALNPAGVARIQEKIAARGGAPHAITDYVGGRVWVDTPGAAEDVVKNLEAKGYRTLESENFLDGSGKDRLGYKAHHMQLVAPDGSLSVELQIQPRGIGEVQGAAHKLYDVLRSPTAPTAVRKQLEDRARKLFQLGEHAPPHDIIPGGELEGMPAAPALTGDHEADAAAAIAHADAFEKLYRAKTGLGDELPGVSGRNDVVMFGKEPLPARYRVLEADQLHASNDPFTFEPNPQYPAGVQGRTYHGDAGKVARENTIANTNAMRPLELLDGTVKVGGPPTISPAGVVIAGNQRSMMLKRMATEAPDKAQAYRQLLEERAAMFGIDPERIRGMKNPVLVRELQHSAERDLRDPKVLGELNRISDIPGMKAKDVVSEGASRAVALSNGTRALPHFAQTFDANEHTLRSYLDTAHGRTFVQQLVADGVIQPQEVARYVDAASGQLTRQGKQSIEDMLYASAIGSPQVVSTAPDFALQKLEHAIPAMVKANRVPGWELSQPLKEAFEILNAKRAAGAKSVEEVLGQGDLLGRSWSDNGQKLARLLESDNKAAISNTFRRYAEAADAAAAHDGGAGLFGDAETPAAAQSRLFNRDGGGAPRFAANRTGRAGDMEGGELGVRMMASLSGTGIGGAAGYAAGQRSDGTPDERAQKALAWAIAGAAIGGGLPWADRSLAAVSRASRKAADVVGEHVVDKLGLEGLDVPEHIQEIHGLKQPRTGAIGAQPVTDLFGNVDQAATRELERGAQGSLLEDAPRSLSAEEKRASARIPRIQQELELTDRSLQLLRDKPGTAAVAQYRTLERQKAALSSELAQLSKLVNRGEKIGSQELAADLFGNRSGAIGNQPRRAARPAAPVTPPASTPPTGPKPPGLVDKALAVWKAGLLTNPTTHIANLVGNTSMAGLETVKDAPAAAFDAMLGVVTGTRTKAGLSASSLSSSWAGAKKGVAEAAQVMKKGGTSAQMAKLQMHREIDFKNPIVDAYTKGIFRSLSAADQVYRGTALARSIDNQARVIARAEGHKGAAFGARVSQLVAAPTDEMALRAVADAELATFNNDGVLSQAAAGLKKPFGAFGDIVLPFSRTPANVATRVAEYSPLGAAHAAGEILVAAMKGTGVSPALQRKVADTLGRSATGTAAIAVGYYLAAHGRLNAGRPQPGSGKADEFDLEGKQPNAVLIGGKWRALNRFSPVGNLLTLGALIHDANQEPDATPSSVAMKGLTGIGQTVAEQSFLQNGSQLVDAIRGAPGAQERYAESMAGSVVPSILGRAAQSIDPTVREVHGPLDAIKARTPYLSKTLEPKVNQLGEDVQRDAGSFAQFFDPTNSRQDRRAVDPLVGELARVGAQLTKLKREKGEAPAAFTNRQRMYGQALENVLQQVMASDDYQQIPELARTMVDQQPELRGRDPAQLAKELQRSQLEDATRTLRRYLTYERKHAAGDVADAQ